MRFQHVSTQQKTGQKLTNGNSYYLASDGLTNVCAFAQSLTI